PASESARRSCSKGPPSRPAGKPPAGFLEIPMKSVLYGLALFAVGGAALAQTPDIIQVQSSQRSPAAATLPTTAATGGVVYHPSVPPNCGANCCAPAKVCIPEPDVRKVPHFCYSKICADFCVPKCHCLSCFSGCGGDCPECDHVRVKNFLIKRVRIEECPTFKCVPGLAPGCGGLPAPAIPGGPVPYEIVPPPTKK